MVGKTKQLAARETNMRKIGQIKLPAPTKSIVKILVTLGSPLVGMTNKYEIQEAVILAASLTKVVNGYIMTGIINTNNKEVELHEPLVELDEVDPAWDGSCSNEFESRVREGEILKQLRLEHLNMDERKLLVQTCLDYQDIFYLPGDKLSSIGAALHSISAEPGTEPINTRLYRLLETQKAEVGKQVKKLLQEGITEESNSPGTARFW
jgi:hypothetical protein